MKFCDDVVTHGEDASVTTTTCASEHAVLTKSSTLRESLSSRRSTCVLEGPGRTWEAIGNLQSRLRSLRTKVVGKSVSSQSRTRTVWFFDANAAWLFLRMALGIFRAELCLSFLDPKMLVPMLACPLTSVLCAETFLPINDEQCSKILSPKDSLLAIGAPLCEEPAEDSEDLVALRSPSNAPGSTPAALDSDRKGIEFSRLRSVWMPGPMKGSNGLILSSPRFRSRSWTERMFLTHSFQSCSLSVARMVGFTPSSSSAPNSMMYLSKILVEGIRISSRAT
mmetsp:Transcript_91144/g.272069  ORF Transcript_91144/g.272069 Transcript_91144/m.272069 type:complete len:280 (+) Transcript_91144:649-1488(+)